MIYLLEGPDGTGKTTLAKTLVIKSIDSRRTCLFFHCTNRSARKTADEDYSEFLEDLKAYKLKDYDVVIDRGWISNIVYTTVYEPNKQHISEKVANQLFSIVDSVIVCLPSSKEKYLQYFTNLTTRREEDYPKDMDKVYDLFNQYANRYRRYDMYRHRREDLESLVIEDLNDNN